jgi:hypothetical protein
VVLSEAESLSFGGDRSVVIQLQDLNTSGEAHAVDVSMPRELVGEWFRDCVNLRGLGGGEPDRII